MSDTHNQGNWNPKDVTNHIGGECKKCGHVHVSIVCTCGCDISGEVLQLSGDGKQQEARTLADVAREHGIDLCRQPSHASGEPGQDVESLSAKFHEIYQAEAKRQGDVRHKEAYADLPENIKEFDRVLARYVIGLVQRGQRAMAEKAAQHYPNGNICTCGALWRQSNSELDMSKDWANHIRSLAGAEPQVICKVTDEAWETASSQPGAVEP